MTLRENPLSPVLPPEPDRPVREKYGLTFAQWVGIIAIAIGLVAILHICVGGGTLSTTEAIAALLNRPIEHFHWRIVWELRVPRAAIAIVAGAMFGLSGAILQAIVRNPLAEPSLTGVTSGSVLFLLLTITVLPARSIPSYLLPSIALVGGILASSMVYLLSQQPNRRSDPLQLVLNGAIVGAIVQSFNSLMLLLDGESLSTILFWLIGSLNGRTWIHWHSIWPWAIVVIPLGLASARVANVLHLGDEVAAGLGLPVAKARAALFFIAVWLGAIAVSVVGAVGFIGLIGPHIARQLVGDDARRLFPLSALLTTLLLLGADFLAQALTLTVGGYESALPVGAVTALLGAPFFLYLVLRKNTIG